MGLSRGFQAPMAKILLVEDDINQNDMVASFLRMDRHVVEVVTTGADAKHFLSISQYDVVILDWNLPDMTGMDILKWYRTNCSGQVIMLTGQASFDSRAEGLDSGADDYVTKPFSMKELSARVRAVLRRTSQTPPVPAAAASFELNPRALTLSKDGKDFQLTQKEFALIEFLSRHPGEIFKAEALVLRVWPAEAEPSTDALRATIKRLREKLWGEIIEAVPGAGYRFGK